MPDDLPLARAPVVDDCEFDRLVLKLLLGNLFAQRRRTREKVERQDNAPSLSPRLSSSWKTKAQLIPVDDHQLSKSALQMNAREKE